MKSVLAGGSCTAAILAFSIAAYAQTTGQTTPPAGQSSSQPTAQSEQMDKSAQQVTLVGCVQSEADYRRAHAGGQGGAVGTGVGAGNEFVLIDASMAGGSSASPSSTASGTTSGTSTSAPGTAAGAPSTAGSPSTAAGTTGTAGTSGMAHKAYELTGPAEGQLQQYVGKRVEVMGRIKGSHGAGATGTTSGSTAGTSSAGTTSGTTTSGTATGTTTGGTTSGTASGTARTGGTDVLGQDLNIPEFEVISVREASGSCPSTPSQR